MDIETFYEEFQLIDALIHPLCIILRRNFTLQGKSILLIANCEILEALEIVRMFIVSKVKKLTIVLPSGMVAEPFEKYDNVRIEKIPKELLAFRKENNVKTGYIRDLSRLFKIMERRSKSFSYLVESTRKVWWLIEYFLWKRWHAKEAVDIYKAKLLSEGYDNFFFVKKMNINYYRSMMYIGKKCGFKEAIALDKDELCFYRMNMNFGERLLIKKIKYFRKMGGGTRRLYKKYYQSPGT